MTSPAKEFQAMVFATLSANADVTAIARGIHDRVPEKPEFPYVSFGRVSSVTDDADCIPCAEYTMQVDVWSRVVGSGECYDLTDAVYKALHNVTPDLPVNALVDMWVLTDSVDDDPDGLTKHGILTVRAIIERR